MPLTPFARPRRSAAPTESPHTPSSVPRSNLGGPSSRSALQPSTSGSPFYTSSSQSVPNLAALSRGGSSSSARPFPSTSYSTPVNKSALRNATSQTGTPNSPYYGFHDPASPSTLSRSSIIPFDREGNREAGASARKRKESLLLVGDGAGSDTPTRKRKAIVRKAPLLDRIQALPQDLLDRLLPDSYTPPPETALPIALFLHTLHFLVRIGTNIDIWGTSKRKEKALFKGEVVDSRSRFERAKGEKVGTTWLCWIVFTALLGISMANAAYLFMASRRYDMNRRTAPLNSPHARASPAPEESELQQDLGPKPGMLKSVGLAVWGFTKAHASPIPLIRLLFGWPKNKVDTPSKKRMIQSLHMWDPPEFNMAFFAYYSPILPLIFQFLASAHLWPALAFMVLLVVQTRFIVVNFEQLVKDKLILQREVMKEYDEGFVYRKVMGARVDKAVQTNEAEMLREYPTVARRH